MASLADYKDLVFGLSEKADGNMKLPPGSSGQNRIDFFNRLGLDSQDIISADLRYGSKVMAVSASDHGRAVPASDALITDQPGLVLSLTVADCLPLYFYDHQRRVIALAHAGWRGIEKDIAAAAIRVFADKYHSRPDDITVFIGPHIRSCHFAVQEDVAAIFSAYPESIIKREGQTYIDLAGIVVRQLISAGLRADNINVSPDCTYCLANKYFSYRRDKPRELEAMVAYLKMA